MTHLVFYKSKLFCYSLNCLFRLAQVPKLLLLLLHSLRMKQEGLKALNG
jgi:hypothetical protein